MKNAAYTFLIREEYAILWLSEACTCKRRVVITQIGGFNVKKQNLAKLFTLSLGASLVLAACGGDNGGSTDSGSQGSDVASGDATGNDFSAVMVTDIGGVDDKSFNQSAWEGLQAWGEENGKAKGANGYDVIQSDTDADFVTNINTGINNGFDLVFGVGYKLKDAMQDAANNNPDTHFAIIDDEIEGENTVSVLFYDNEAAFLAGVAAAHSTKTNKIGFVGGQEGPVIDRFEAGFVEGVESVNPDIKVDVQYVGSFGDAAKAKTIANGMYSSGIDIIYQAAGDSGNGVFSEARDIVTSDPARELWVIGVDRDQAEEGKVELADGTTRELTLTSTVKGVGTAAQDIANLAMNDEFPAGEVMRLGLKDNGVSLTDGILEEDALKAVREAEEKIINGEITVSEKP